MFGAVSFLFVLCHLAHNLSAQKSLPPIYAVVNSEVVLQPAPVTDKIQVMTWKHNSDLALEWFGGQVTSYREFKGRTTLDTTSGVMTIKNLIPMLSGTYTAEINNKIISSQEVKIYDPVPKPTLTRKDGENANSHVFTCDYSASANAKPVNVTWKLDNVEKPGSTERTVQGKENCLFVCELSNPASKQSSEVVENPSCNDSPSPGSIIGIIILVLFLVVLLFLLCFYVVFVNTPHVLKDNYIITAVQNSTCGKWVGDRISTSKGRRDDAAVEGGRKQNGENDPMVDSNPTGGSSAPSGANETSDK